MNYYENLQAIIDYVELHLQRKQEPLKQEEIAKIAGCSFDFFQKVFSYMNKISFADYVRYRKMTLAGYDLKSTSMKIVDISYKYGYDSPTSFTKAFQQFHGMTPRDAKQSTSILRVYPKMQISKKQAYTWRIESKPAFRLVGKSIFISQNNQIAIPNFWSECQRDGTFSKLITMDTGMRQGMFGVYKEYDAKLGVNYAIMVNSTHEKCKGYQEVMIPENTWAIFDCIGPTPQAIQNGWKYLREEWLVKYPFRHAPSPELEWYSNGNSYDENFHSQIWIPIIEEE